MIQRLIKSVGSQKRSQREADLYRNLIRHEARIGGQLFGTVPAGTRREFFCLDQHTWVWHEEWQDKLGQPQIRTTRYDIRPNGILKAQNGQYQPLKKREALRLIEAIDVYERRVMQEIYAPII